MHLPSLIQCRTCLQLHRSRRCAPQNAEHRAIISGGVETAAFTFQAWVPLFVYNTGQVRRFDIGYEMAAMFLGLEIVLALAVRYCAKPWPLTV